MPVNSCQKILCHSKHNYLKALIVGSPLLPFVKTFGSGLAAAWFLLQVGGPLRKRTCVVDTGEPETHAHSSLKKLKEFLT